MRADVPRSLLVAVADLHPRAALIKTGANAGVNQPLNATHVNLDDVSQYRLGADSPAIVSGATGFAGAGVLAGTNAAFGSAQAKAGLFAATSDSLPAAQFPQFTSAGAGTYGGATGPFEPFAGAGFAALKHGDNEYARLTRTADLTSATGTSGAWNRVTESSNGWQPMTFDLSAYAGKQVEVSITYLSDTGGGGRGAFVDDVRLLVGGTTVDSQDFESGLGPWTAVAAPAGSPGNVVAWARSGALLHSSAAIITRRSVLLGFGLESVPATAQRTALITKALTTLG